MYELFGLRSNHYLSKNSNNEIPLLGNTRKRRGFAYITLHKELLKLRGIEFNGRKLVIEKVKTLPKKTTGKNKQAFLQTQSPAIDFKMETFEQVPPIQRVTGSYRNAVISKKGAIALFSDSIATRTNFAFTLKRSQEPNQPSSINTL